MLKHRNSHIISKRGAAVLQEIYNSGLDASQLESAKADLIGTCRYSHSHISLPVYSRAQSLIPSHFHAFHTFSLTVRFTLFAFRSLRSSLNHGSRYVRYVRYVRSQIAARSVK